MCATVSTAPNPKKTKVRRSYRRFFGFGADKLTNTRPITRSGVCFCYKREGAEIAKISDSAPSFLFFNVAVGALYKRDRRFESPHLIECYLLPFGGSAIVGHAFDGFTFGKRHRADAFQRFRQSQAFKAYAFKECAVADSLEFSTESWYAFSFLARPCLLFL